jgi:hypothetical protein
VASNCLRGLDAVQLGTARGVAGNLEPLARPTPAVTSYIPGLARGPIWIGPKAKLGHPPLPVPTGG